MGSLAASVVINRVRDTLIEPVARFWTDANLIDYLNAGITSIINVKPDASAKVASIPLVGGPDQTLPADAVLLLDVLGTQNGLSCRKIKLTDLWHNNPTWRVGTQTTDPRQYSYDIDAPLNFQVSPPAVTGSTLTVKYGYVPTRITSLSDVIPADNYFETALWAYVLSLAYAKNTVRGDTVKHRELMDLFDSELGMRTRAQVTEKPQGDKRVGQ